MKYGYPAFFIWGITNYIVKGENGQIFYHSVSFYGGLIQSVQGGSFKTEE